MSKNEKNKVKIGITTGDVNGIGIELLLKTFSDNLLFNHCIPVFYGSTKVLSFYRKAFNTDIKYHSLRGDDSFNQNALNVLNCWEEEFRIQPGEVTEEGGKYAYISLEAAVNDLFDGKIDALVTNPINKHNMKDAGFPAVGHTEYLTKKSNKEESLMLMTSEFLRVALVTEHIALAEVAPAVTKEKILSKLNLLNKSLKKDFGIDKPRIAVLGLNPHASDKGLMGNEEKKEIIPAIETANEKKMLTFGPYAADGFFGSGNYKNFDAVLAMYHDQGLTPFKTIAFDSGVNFTAGLPVVRTSPDHGPAYEIAGKDIAIVESFRSAVFTAIDIVNNRNRYEENHSNPLQKSELVKENG